MNKALLKKKAFLTQVIALSLGCLFLLVILFFLINHFFASSPEETMRVDSYGTNVDFSEEEQRWRQRIQEGGGEATYWQFKEAFQEKDPNIQHNTVHVFGGVLYEEEGVAGIGICDSSFSFGCYHGFFSRAIVAEGLSVVRNLGAACTQFGEGEAACQHGIGHGVLEYLGKDEVQAALSTCRESAVTDVDEDNPFGCAGGVFMEYHFPIDFGSPNLMTIREMREENKFDPCPNSFEEYLYSCYHSLAQWWLRSADYTQVGQWCDEITNLYYREGCFRGVGNVAAPNSGYAAEQIVEMCKKMPHLDGDLWCRDTAAWALENFKKPQEEVLKVCEGVPQEYASRCFSQRE